MARLRDVLRPVADAYAKAKGIAITRFLGDGNDGAAWETDRNSAVKVIERLDSYLRERDVYLRLQDRGVTDIKGFAVPQLIDCDDTLQVVEMTIVFPPYVLDFAKSYVDRPPDFSPEVLAETEARFAELFADRWPVVQSILAWLQAYGIHSYDPLRGNIRFADESEDED